MPKSGELTGGLHWKDEPEEHDLPAASDYLSLLFDDADTAAVVERLRSRRPSSHKAKDLLRALIRAGAGARLIVADGYHRICASYHVDEDAAIPCRLLDSH